MALERLQHERELAKRAAGRGAPARGTPGGPFGFRVLVYRAGFGVWGFGYRVEGFGFWV